MGKHNGPKGPQPVSPIPTGLTDLGVSVRREGKGLLEHQRLLATIQDAPQIGRLALHTGTQVNFPVSETGRPLMGADPSQYRRLGGIVSARLIGNDWEVSLLPEEPVGLPADITHRRSYGEPLGNTPLWDQTVAPRTDHIFSELVAVVDERDAYHSQMFGRRVDGNLQELRGLTSGRTNVGQAEATYFARVCVQTALGIIPQQH